MSLFLFLFSSFDFFFLLLTCVGFLLFFFFFWVLTCWIYLFIENKPRYTIKTEIGIQQRTKKRKIHANNYRISI